MVSIYVYKVKKEHFDYGLVKVLVFILNCNKLQKYSRKAKKFHSIPMPSFSPGLGFLVVSKVKTEKEN